MCRYIQAFCKSEVANLNFAIFTILAMDIMLNLHLTQMALMAVFGLYSCFTLILKTVL